VLRAVDDGKSRAEIIDLFQLSRATIKRYVKQRRETGTMLPLHDPGLQTPVHGPQRRRPRQKWTRSCFLTDFFPVVGTATAASSSFKNLV